MNIEDIIEKLKCVTRCHPNAVDTLVCEAIEMLQAEREQMMKQEPAAFISPNGDFRKTCESNSADEWGAKFTPLYAKPVPQDQPTDEQMKPVGVVTRIVYNDDFVSKVFIRWDTTSEPSLGDKLYAKPERIASIIRPLFKSDI